MNHIAKVTEQMFFREPEKSFKEFINYNLIFKFYQFLDYPCIQNFLLNLMGVTKKSLLPATYQEKFHKYLKSTEFFVNIGKDLLFVASNPNSQLKFNVKYKASEFVSDILLLENLVDRNFENNQVNSEKFLPILFEESKNFKSDIDGLENIIEENTKKKKLPKNIKTILVASFKRSSLFENLRNEIPKQDLLMKNFNIENSNNFIKIDSREFAKDEIANLDAFLVSPIKKHKIEVNFDEIIKPHQYSPLKKKNTHETVLFIFIIFTII